ncbi:Ribokinase-like protein [Lindgomyces ingoldianus]|uniref:Ribokinase-like protein n=1 Tax=Lindgomyces ingoldianus TaxID=673940 RepID=A0ACB6RD59_9PLEO|nr:Ribokinase-like protein [Lindgomyces ingoldianus]KAF2477179.1 Ribokinase-like protein [Lindgomyces ingoldianus]
MAPKTISIIGGLDYDLIMIANRIPDGGESLLANEYFEALGGKGANSAIATYRTCHKKPMDAHETPAIETLEKPNDDQAEPTTAEELRAAQDQLINLSGYELEINVRMVGAVGDDKYGERFYAELNKNGVDSSGIVTVPNTQSSICFVMVENYTRENRCLFTLGATATWTKEHFLKVEDLGHGVRPDLCVAQMEIHKESEAAIMSGRDLDEVNKDTWPVICQEFLNRGVKNVVVTLGEKGAYYATATDRDHCPAYKVEVVDTTAAALTITKLGAQKGIPWADEIDRFDVPFNDPDISTLTITDEASVVL